MYLFRSDLFSRPAGLFGLRSSGIIALASAQFIVRRNQIRRSPRPADLDSLHKEHLLEIVSRVSFQAPCQIASGGVVTLVVAIRLPFTSRRPFFSNFFLFQPLTRQFGPLRPSKIPNQKAGFPLRSPHLRNKPDDFRFINFVPSVTKYVGVPGHRPCHSLSHSARDTGSGLTQSVPDRRLFALSAVRSFLIFTSKIINH